MDIKEAQKLRNQGKSYRQIGQELGVPKSTVAHKLALAKFQAQPQQPQSQQSFDYLNQPHVLPPAAGQITVPPYMQYSGIFRAGQNYYLPPDLAIRESRDNARNMWNNLLIREPLQARLWAAAENDWHIEPQDKIDPQQVQIAGKIQRLIEEIPDFLKFRYSLLKSRWFGVYGVQLMYQWNAEKHLTVQKWSELHGDSLTFKMSSDEVGVYVTGTGGIDNKRLDTEAGYIGRVHKFDEAELKFDNNGMPYQPLSLNERQAVVIMSYDPQASDFLDPRAAGGIKGLGLRSTCYPVWLQMTEITGWMIDWLERFGTGVTIYKFLRGNQASYEAARQLAESQDVNGAVMLPVDMVGGQPLEGIQRQEPSPVGLENVQNVIDFFAQQLRRFIVGQDATSQPMNAGLGSEIADVQESTFGRIIHFDCVDLQETLTRQLVHVIQDWSFPGTPHCRLVVDFAKPNVHEQLEAVKTAWDMGVSFVEDEVRSLVGMTKPTAEDVVVSNKPQQQQTPGMQQAVPGTPVQNTEDQLRQELQQRLGEEEDEDEQTPFQFAEAEALSDEEIQKLGAEAVAGLLKSWQEFIDDTDDIDEKIDFAKWEEGKHPREGDGKFTSGSGGDKESTSTNTKKSRPLSKARAVSKIKKHLPKKPPAKVRNGLRKNLKEIAGHAVGMGKEAFNIGIETAGKIARVTGAVSVKAAKLGAKFVSAYAKNMERRFGRRGAVLLIGAGILGTCAGLGLIAGPVDLISSGAEAASHINAADVFDMLGKGWNGYKTALDWMITNVPKAASSAKEWWDTIPDTKKNQLLYSMPLWVVAYTIATTRGAGQLAYDAAAFPVRAVREVIHGSITTGRDLGQTIGLGGKRKQDQ